MIGRARRPRAGLVLAALAMLCALAPAPALCAGARPWLAPGGQNATEAADPTANATANPTANATEAAPAAQPSPKPASQEDPVKALQQELLRAYYQRMMTLDERLPDLFSRRVRDKEAMALEIMRQTQARRGLLRAFAGARVYLDELVFERIEQALDLARWRVRGAYHVAVSSAFETVAEDALFVLLPEDGGWKIWERRDN